jgi:hypothetical protein
MSEEFNLQTPDPVGTENDGPEVSDFGNQYLQSIPEEDREVVSKYVGEWDKNVTQEFQKRAERIKAYEELGDPDSLRQAWEVAQMLSSDPVSFYNELTSYMTQNADSLGWNPNPDNPTPPPDWDGVPEEFVNKFTEMEKRLAELDGSFNEMTSKQREEQELAMLDNELKRLHNEHGEFDDTFVISQLANGATPDDAIKAWEALVQNVIDSRKNPPPPIMGSENAGSPLDQVDPSKLKDPNVRKQIGIDYLTKSLRGG